MRQEYKTIINFFNKDVEINEFLVQDYKVILKALIEVESTPSILIDNIYKLLYTHTSLTKTDIDQLNILELLHLLFEVKLRSSSNIVTLTIQNNNTTTNLNINLDNINGKLYNIAKNYQTFSDTISGMTVFYNLPTLKEIFEPTQNINNCFKTVIYNNVQLDLFKLEISQKIKIFEKIPLSLYNIFVQKINSHIQEIQKNDFLKGYNIENLQLPLVFQPRYIVSLLQLLFYENLLNLYQNIFALCKYTNLTPEYIENMTVGEFGLYIKMLEVSLTSKQNSTSNQLPTAPTEDV